MTIDLFGLTKAEIGEALYSYNIQQYRCEQIARWMYQRQANSFDQMTDIPKQLRLDLQQSFSIIPMTVQAKLCSQDGKTQKYLLQFADGMAVETVLMQQIYGNSVCVSSQVGCAMGCVFCASTLRGVERNLTPGEILAQVVFSNSILNDNEQKVNSIVIMGSGEPLANYDNVVRFLRLIHEEYCLNFSYRNITISTCGLVPGILQLAQEKLPVTLAISLHAPTNDLRSKLMPINNKYPIEQVLAAADEYAAVTGRRVTYEYVLIADVNDGEEQAHELALLLKGRLANVNLIPINSVQERGFLRPKPNVIKRFLDILTNRHITATLRREMGTDIQAACGQLRHRNSGVS